jgi:phospholipid/cholesterol/gamma-HCH transport system substrate-binding protein
MNPRSFVPTLVPLAVAAIALVVLLSGGGSPYTVRAVFADATGLRVDSDVKVGGVAGGHVASIALNRHDQAVVTLDIDPTAAPIGRGATATIRPANLLGEYYVDLQPGDGVKDPVPPGATLPVSATGDSVGLDQVLDTLDATTRERLAILINETGIALGETGPQFAATLAGLPPTLGQARGVLAQLDGDNQNIEAMISQGDAVLGAIDSRRGDLQDLVSTAAGALATTASHQASLGRTLRAAPAALAELHSTLANLTAASDQLRPAARALLATSAPLTRTLTVLPGFTAAVSSTLHALRDASPALTRLGRLGTPPVTQIRPVAARLEGYIGELAPVLNTFDQGGFMDTLMRWMYNWASVTSTRDALGHLFRVTVAPNADLVSEALDSLTGSTASRRHRSDHRPPAAKPTPAAPTPSTSPSLSGAASGIVAGTVNKLHQTLGNAGHAVSQLSQTVSGVLGKLTGSAASGSTGQSPPPPQHSLGALLNYLLKP